MVQPKDKVVPFFKEMTTFSCVEAFPGSMGTSSTNWVPQYPVAREICSLKMTLFRKKKDYPSNGGPSFKTIPGIFFLLLPGLGKSWKIQFPDIQL